MVLLFVYFNFSEVTQPLKNVPIKGSGPHGPFPKKFYPRFTRGPGHVLESKFKSNNIDDVIDNHVEDPEKDNAKFSPELGMIFNERDQELRDLGYQKHAFNMLISNRLGYHRDVPDTRNAACKDKSYRTDLPVASVIICFYNEALSALLRTVHSVLDRTPARLLHEIILVDDDSDLDDLKGELDEYIQKYLTGKIKVIRNTKREGLIRGRMIGAAHATGEVLVFLDSHCEVNVLWLQPLLAAIREDRHMVVCPVIDIISADTLAYSASPVVRGGFNWGLHFRCKDKSYRTDLPVASVIICFYNEALSALLRTVHSVLDRTPARLLHEIILVDDDSDLDDLKGELDEYIQKYLTGKIKVIRNTKREGLIRGRMIGAAHATGRPSCWCFLLGVGQRGLCPWSLS